MGATCNLVGEGTKIFAGKDSVVIRQYIGGITGGRTLDVSGFSGDAVRAGHLIVRSLDADGVNYTYKPLGVTDGAYVALADGEEYVGVVVCTKPVSEPLVAIMDDGRVNDSAMPYPLTDAMKTALKSALPKLIFEHD
ncbi:MAG: hypothetical protein LUC22_03045 [Prevotella sp.]|nr:hypothetical protein [Prevotella sp.]